MKISTKNLLIIPLFTALMIVGTYIRIPFPLLPVTLQTVICAVAGMILGPAGGALSMVVYAALGLAGVPVFAGGGGIGYIFNKSFGFILGFIAGAYVMGKLTAGQKSVSRINVTFALMAGLLTIYVLGVTYMFLIIRFYLGNTQAGLLFVITANIPYLIKDIVLFITVALFAPSVLQRLQPGR